MKTEQGTNKYTLYYTLNPPCGEVKEHGQRDKKGDFTMKAW